MNSAINPALSQTPIITVNSPDDVQINGQSAGQVVDAQKNNPALASSIQTALATWWAAQQAEQQAVVASLQRQLNSPSS
ncbi:MAG: hypothetical protein KGL39_59175 [Patescibacteria group bacterium]|nr:hypothetical protein [Patescibacteria group bacterium]